MPDPKTEKTSPESYAHLLSLAGEHEASDNLERSFEQFKKSLRGQPPLSPELTLDLAKKIALELKRSGTSIFKLELLKELGSFHPEALELLESIVLERRTGNGPFRLLEALTRIEALRATDPYWSLRTPLHTEGRLPSWSPTTIVGDEARFRWPVHRKTPAAVVGARENSGLELTSKWLTGAHATTPPPPLAHLIDSDPLLERIWIAKLRDGTESQRTTALSLIANARGNEPEVQRLLLACLGPSMPPDLRAVAADRLAWIAEHWPLGEDGESVMTRSTQRAIAEALASESRSSRIRDPQLRGSLVRAMRWTRPDDIASQLVLVRELRNPREGSLTDVLSAFRHPPTDPTVQQELVGILDEATPQGAVAKLQSGIGAAELLAKGITASSESPSPLVTNALARSYLRNLRLQSWRDIVTARFSMLGFRLPEETLILLWQALGDGRQLRSAEERTALAGLLAKLPPPREAPSSSTSALEHAVIAALTHADPTVRTNARQALGGWAEHGPEAVRLASHLVRESRQMGAACKPKLLQRVVHWLSQ